MSLTVNDRQREYLFLLQEVQGTRPILIQRPQGGDLNIEGKFWRDWKKAWSSQPFITCSVLTNEIAFDPDQKDWNLLKQGMDTLLSFLKKQQIPYLLSWSGGNGVHLEIFFNPDGINFSPELIEGIQKYHIDVRRTVRMFLATWILDQAGVTPESIKLDWGKIKWSGTSNGSMIRMLGCQRPNGGVKTLITDIPDKAPIPNTLPLVFPSKILLWDIRFLAPQIIRAIEIEIENNTPEEPDPFDIWMDAQIEKAKAEGRLKESRGGKGKCIGLKNALKGGIGDGHRDEVATGLALAMKYWKNESKEKTLKTIQKWCDTCNPPLDFHARAIDRKIEVIYLKPKSDHPPCPFFVKAGLCDGAKCKVRKGKK